MQERLVCVAKAFKKNAKDVYYVVLRVKRAEALKLVASGWRYTTKCKYRHYSAKVK